MTAFMDKDFLLTTDVAKKLYHEVAADLPVIDYHSHLQQGEIAERKTFRNIAELWLGGDHYKWRLMRTAGVPEEYCTGTRSDKEKFLAFCKVLPLAIGNPIYQWSHLELRRIFGIDLIINEKNAEAIWEQANAKLATMDTWTFLVSYNQYVYMYNLNLSNMIDFLSIALRTDLLSITLHG